MNPSPTDPRPRRAAIVEWLVRVNSQVGGWAASMSWWRLAVLFLVILVAGSMLGSKLNLNHDKLRVEKSGKDSVDITISGSDGIRIRHRERLPSEAPAVSAPPGVAGAPAPQAAASESQDKDAIDFDEDDDKAVSKSIFTFRGFLGDLGAVLLIILFAYLAAAKIVVRKVAESDAKVRTALNTAEREAMERQLVQARLQVLQAQVEPHFLFNTLAAVDYLIETDPPRASQMQKALINYLRGALPQMREESSTLGRELRLIRSYLDLIKMRIEDRLEVEFVVPGEVQAAEFPPMVLQSLVENAIKHGIEPKPEGGKVSVAARIVNGLLWVEVKDTGVGIIDYDTLEGPTSGTGLGLQNIRERLAMLYPGKSRLVLRSDDETGTSVKIAVPFRPASQAAPATAGQGQEKPA